MIYLINGLRVPFDKLHTKAHILEYLEENGGDDRALGHIREEYQDKFGNELMWRYPISDGVNAGAFIVCCQEGFLSLPWNWMEPEAYEILDLERASMHDADSMQYFIDDWKLFSDDLLGAMTSMHKILAPSELFEPEE